MLSGVKGVRGRENAISNNYTVTITDYYRADIQAGDIDAISRLYRYALNETLLERGLTPRLVGRPTVPISREAVRTVRFAPRWRAISTDDLHELEAAIMAVLKLRSGQPLA